MLPGRLTPTLRKELGATSSTDVLVGIVGRIDPPKQIDTLLRAAAATGNHDIRVAIVGGRLAGSQGYVDELERLGAELLGDRITRAGVRADIPAVMRALDVLVNTSTAEAFGLTLLEAQATATPVVATRAGGAPEFVLDGATGLLVEPGNPIALASALTTLAEDPALRRRLGEGARTHVERNYTQEDHADRLTSLYRAMARPVRADPAGGEAAGG